MVNELNHAARDGLQKESPSKCIRKDFISGHQENESFLIEK